MFSVIKPFVADFFCSIFLSISPVQKRKIQDGPVLYVLHVKTKKFISLFDFLFFSKKKEILSFYKQ